MSAPCVSAATRHPASRLVILSAAKDLLCFVDVENAR
jgi:hypothetical protein